MVSNLRGIDWRKLINAIWKAELWYQDNYKRLNNKNRRNLRKLLDNATSYCHYLKTGRSL